MPDVSKLDLYELSLDEQYFADDPDPHMLAALARHPWLARSSFGIVVTERDAVDELLRMDDRLKTPADHIVRIMGGEGTNWARFEHECLIARDGDAHTRIRSAVSRAFTPRAVDGYRERIGSVVSGLLDEWAPRGRFDFEDFASRFPVAVVFGLLGVPQTHLEDVKEWLEILGQSFSLNPALFPQIDGAFNRLWDFAEGLVQQRLAAGCGGDADILDVLIAAETGGSLSRTEVLDLLLFLFTAGYDTSKNQLGHIVNLLLDRPALWDRCANDREFCAEVVEESLRQSGVATSYRNVVLDLHYRGVTFPAGTMLIFPLGVVCRYTAQFDQAIEFCPGRPDARRHTAFGRGVHLCLGQFLARLQIAEGLHLIARRLQNPRRDGEMVWRLFPGVWGPLRLPIAFDAAV